VVFAPDSTGQTMLRRASVTDVKTGKVTGKDGHLVVTMRVYPRFLSRSLVSEYVASLAPAPSLFARYRALKQASGDQNGSFQGAQYQRRFELEDGGLDALSRLAERSRHEDVFLICQCDRRELCHVDLMLLIAEHRFGARIGELADTYAEFRQRLG
jgi:uncharacterized protein YeaO (DUF488 family)